MGFSVSELWAQETMVVKFSVPLSWFFPDTMRGYDILRTDDSRFTCTSEPGKPMLPVFVPTYIIPYWKTVKYVEVVSVDSVQVPGYWRIYPAQDQTDTSWVPPDTNIYYSDSLYPGIRTGEVTMGSFDGAVLARPYSNVFQYRPLSGKLFLYTEVTLKLVFSDNEPPICAKQRYAHVQEIYDDMLAQFTENDGDIGAWYRRPAIIEPGGKTPPIPVFAIITTENQMDEADDYADWTDRRGYPTTVVDVADILANSPGGNPAQKVFNWIQTQYQAGLSFVLFLGHETQVPYRYLRYGDTTGLPQKYSSDNWWIPSDLYFSSVSCIFSQPCQYYWDCDGDQAYGEQNHDAGSWDYYPEVFVGRVLAQEDPNEAQRWVDKVLNYEKDPGQSGSLTRASFISEEDPCPQCEETQEEHYPPVGWSFKDVYDEGADYVLSVMDTAPCGWVNIYSHGMPTAFTTEILWADSMLSVLDPGEDLSDLQNTDKYFLVYDIACLQACFDPPDSINWNDQDHDLSDTTIAEGFTEAYSQKGAVAFLGNTRHGGWVPSGGSYDLHRAFLDYIFNPLGPSNKTFLGVAEAYSRAQPSVVHPVAREHNLFGSPLTDMWDIATPPVTYTQHPSSIPTGQQDFTVRVLSSLKPVVPVSGARVTLKGCGIYYFDKVTNAQGYVTYTINPQETGTLTVTATKHNRKPKESYCTVTSKGGFLVSEVDSLPSELCLRTSLMRGSIGLVYGIPPDAGPVSLKIYDISGREAKLLLSGETQPGWYEESWRPTSPGVYVVVLRTGKKTISNKVIFPGGE